MMVAFYYKAATCYHISTPRLFKSMNSLFLMVRNNIHDTSHLKNIYCTTIFLHPAVFTLGCNSIWNVHIWILSQTKQ